jgi:hypothetical protein
VLRRLADRPRGAFAGDSAAGASDVGDVLGPSLSRTHSRDSAPRLRQAAGRTSRVEISGMASAHHEADSRPAAAIAVADSRFAAALAVADSHFAAGLAVADSRFAAALAVADSRFAAPLAVADSHFAAPLAVADSHFAAALAVTEDRSPPESAPAARTNMSLVGAGRDRPLRMRTQHRLRLMPRRRHSQSSRGHPTFPGAPVAVWLELCSPFPR